jgi:hypothetical protein
MSSKWISPPAIHKSKTSSWKYTSSIEQRDSYLENNEQDLLLHSKLNDLGYYTKDQLPTKNLGNSENKK